MAVVVIGAQGALGRLCVEALRESGLEVVRAGRRRERDAPDFRFVDLDDPASVAAACADADLVVSTVRHPEHSAERSVLAGGGVLLNVATLTALDRAELKSESPGQPGLVVVDGGLAPGVYSLLLKGMLSAHPEADWLQIAGCFSVVQTSGPGGPTDLLYTALHGKGRRETRVIEFPQPIGRRRCLHIGGAETGLFGGVAEGRSARVFLAFHQRPLLAQLLALNSVGLLSRLPRGFFTIGRRQTARRTTTEPKRDMLSVGRAEQTLAACCVEGVGDYLMTAGATAVFAEALLTRFANGPAMSGVVGADEIFDLDQLRDGFEQRGIRIVPVVTS